jgi:DNA (cytosine-5)-methyltransferase 1
MMLDMLGGRSGGHGLELVVDSFAGGGGASTGIRLALGRDPDAALNHDPVALAIHKANHPGSIHYCQDIFSVEPNHVTMGRPVGLLWASPDCFPAGTMILTQKGFAPIESLCVDDLVLTHKGHWRRVTCTMKTVKDTLIVRGQGHYGLEVSAEHPFLSRAAKNAWRNNTTVKEWSTPSWVKADELKKGSYWATPVSADPLATPPVEGRSLPFSEGFWWLVGRYLADGWSRIREGTGSELVICCGKAKADVTRERLNFCPPAGGRACDNELRWGERETRTEIQFTASHKGMVQWLRDHFGHLAQNKRLPGWALGLDENSRRAILDGYFAGDGWESGNIVEVGSVSKALILGMRLLAESLGRRATLYFQAGRPTTIEGRAVTNVRDAYKVRWRKQLLRQQTTADDKHSWSAIRDVAPGRQGVDVYNLSVEEDESYIAEGVVVHNCTHFSKAKGGAPKRNAKIRDLAWAVVKWAREARPRVIILENVEEFVTWGPLSERGEIVKGREGETFRQWLRQLRRLGYRVRHRELRACDYGAPTIRKRFFLIARRDGRPIVWPKPTHGPGRPQPYRTAADIIDWSIPCPSIFERARPLAENTLRRIAEGIRRYVIEAAEPFIVTYYGPKRPGDFRGNGLSEQLGTQTTENRHALVTPYVVNLTHGGRLEPGNEPLRTITTAHRGEKAIAVPVLVTNTTGHAPANTRGPVSTLTTGGQQMLACAGLVGVGGRAGQSRPRGAGESTATTTAKADTAVVAATMIQTGYGERPGQTPRALDLQKPLGTIVAGGGKHAVAAACLLKHYGGVVGQPADAPMGTVTTVDHHSVLAASIMRQFGNSVGAPADDPLGTVTAGGGGKSGLVTSNLVKLRGTCRDGQPVTEPMPTVTAGGTHIGEVRAFLVKYFGTAIGQDLRDPLHTVTTKDRLGLVTVQGEEYVIADIGLRMLTPRELFLAQGFPADYVIDPVFNGKPLPKSKQVRACGNSVCPPLAEALVRANCADMAVETMEVGA